MATLKLSDFHDTLTFCESINFGEYNYSCGIVNWFQVMRSWFLNDMINAGLSGDEKNPSVVLFTGRFRMRLVALTGMPLRCVG